MKRAAFAFVSLLTLFSHSAAAHHGAPHSIAEYSVATLVFVAAVYVFGGVGLYLLGRTEQNSENNLQQAAVQSEVVS